MGTKKFRTKTNFFARDNGNRDGVWEVALDIGYSAVKLMSPNIVASFPSYARRVDDDYQYAGSAPESSILYRSLDSDDMWVVGEIAQNLIGSNDTSDSESSLYGRDRYYNDMFRVISEVGLGIGMQDNRFGGPRGRKIVVQTGLPERYMSDESVLRETLAGSHSFALKIGNNKWKTYSFNLEPNNVFVMSQPKGTLFSVITENNGSFIPNAEKFLSSSVLILDPGFGTFDIFAIQSGVVTRGETFADLGMKRILHETSRAIRDNYGVEISVPNMQKHLETGTVRKFDKRNFTSQDYEFDKLLSTACDKVCDEALNRLSSSFNLSEFEYIVVTGGTGAAWYKRIEDKLKDLTFLTIVKGNQNDTLDFIYSNVRGYYNYRFNKLA